MVATLAKYNTPETTVPIHHLVNSGYSVQTNTAFVVFEGRRAPTAYRSTQLWDTWSLECLYALSEYDDARAMVNLLREAYDSADGRLIFTANQAPEKAFDSISPENKVVVVEGWDVQREPGGIVRISMEATEVHD